MVNNCCVPFMFTVLVLYCGILVVQLRFKAHTPFKCRINLIIIIVTACPHQK